MGTNFEVSKIFKKWFSRFVLYTVASVLDIVFISYFMHFFLYTLYFAFSRDPRGGQLGLTAGFWSLDSFSGGRGHGEKNTSSSLSGAFSRSIYFQKQGVFYILSEGWGFW